MQGVAEIYEQIAKSDESLAACCLSMIFLENRYPLFGTSNGRTPLDFR
jgi:hypothetical protein